MKLKLTIFFVALISLILLSGCINNEPKKNNSDNPSLQRPVSQENTTTENNTENVEVSLQELQGKYNELNEKFSGCLETKTVCESRLMTFDCNCSEQNFECPECPMSTDCTSISSSLSSQISDCIEKKSIIQNSLNDCSAEKSACIEEKNSFISDLNSANTALAEPLHLSIYHYVKGNLFESEGYRYTQAFAGSNTKKVFVGLDYNGGTDNFFVPSGSIIYGLNLVRWYALTLTDVGTFESKILKGIYESDAGDTVLIEEDDMGILQLKIKATEFDAETSKESLALRRITVLYVK